MLIPTSKLQGPFFSPHRARNTRIGRKTAIQCSNLRGNLNKVCMLPYRGQMGGGMIRRAKRSRLVSQGLNLPGAWANPSPQKTNSRSMVERRQYCGFKVKDAGPFPPPRRPCYPISRRTTAIQRPRFRECTTESEGQLNGDLHVMYQSG